ncbi:MAG: hypothetical protein U0T81_10120 [Saprospiraceae bacterium]
MYKLIQSHDAGITWTSIYDNPDIWTKGGWIGMRLPIQPTAISLDLRLYLIHMMAEAIGIRCI